MLQHIYHKCLREARESAQEDERARIEPADISVPMVSARVLNFGKNIPLKNLKAHNYGNIHLPTNGVGQGPLLWQDHSLKESQGS